jgi:hypothetical protein
VVTDWAVRLALVLLVLLVIALAFWGMRRGWVARGRRQADLPEPPAVQPLVEVYEGPLTGSFLATTTAGEWLDRIVAHGLGARSRAELTVGQGGVLFEREGAPDVFVPAADLRAARLDKGIAGFVYERGGVVIVTWALGDRLLDTGFRAARTEDHVRVIGALARLVTVSHTLPNASQERGTP